MTAGVVLWTLAWATMLLWLAAIAVLGLAVLLEAVGRLRSAFRYREGFPAGALAAHGAAGCHERFLPGSCADPAGRRRPAIPHDRRPLRVQEDDAERSRLWSEIVADDDAWREGRAVAWYRPVEMELHDV